MSNQVHVVVGAGQAGVHAAVAMRQAGFAGRILVVGDEIHLPYERPPLSKDVLTAEEEPGPTHVVAPARLAEHGVELKLGAEVTGIDAGAQRLMLAGGETVPYDKLLLATGGSARRLEVPGGERALTLRTLDDARTVRGQLRPGSAVVCIGAGVIGLEIAAAARARGCTVTVLEAGTRAMARSVAPPFSAYMEALHLAAGVDLRFSVAVEAIGPSEVVADGSPVPADTVVAGIGIARNTRLAEAAGVTCDNGIEVDEFARTNVPDVFAAGDVAAFWHARLGRRLRLEAWRHAQNHGIAAGRVMAGVLEPYRDVPWFWTDQFGINLQVAGLPAEDHAAVMRGAVGEPSFVAFYLDASGAVVGAAGVNAPREVRAAMSLIDAGTPVDAAALADPARPMQRIVAEAKRLAGPKG